MVQFFANFGTFLVLVLTQLVCFHHNKKNKIRGGREGKLFLVLFLVLYHVYSATKRKTTHLSDYKQKVYFPYSYSFLHIFM